MLLLAHVGFTVGLAQAIDQGLSGDLPLVGERLRGVPGSLRYRLRDILHAADYRLLALGALLPDIIDKPVGVYLFRDTFENGRILAHTLAFLLIMLAIGLHRYRSSGKHDVLVIAFGCFMHLMLDEMWLSHQTLLWPLFGLTFPRKGVEDFAESIWEGLTTNTHFQIEEAIGFSILVAVGLRLLREQRIRQFLSTGVLG